MSVAAARFTIDSSASERSPTEPVSRQAAILSAMVTIAAAMESHANFASGLAEAIGPV